MTASDCHAITTVAHSAGTSYPVDRAKQALLIRAARDPEERAFTVRAILAARADWRAWLTRCQRDWQSKVSRRPARGAHHDSWAIRESYVRGGSSADYLPTPGAPLRPGVRS